MFPRTSLILLPLCGPALLLAAQTQPVVGSAQPPDPPSAVRAVLPSATLQPSLDVLRTALVTLRLDRWKAPNSIRDEAQANINSIQRDVQSTLPALLTTADAAPASAAKALSVYRNVDALYDVTLRVDAAARLAAPPDQMSAIDQALARLDDSRRALGDQLQQTAAAQEGQIVHLQAALKAVPPPAPQPPPPVVKCAAPPVVHSTKKKPTTVAKPAAPPANPQNSATPSH